MVLELRRQAGRQAAGGLIRVACQPRLAHSPCVDCKAAHPPVAAPIAARSYLSPGASPTSSAPISTHPQRSSLPVID